MPRLPAPPVLSFRPLRREGPAGRVLVASYAQWHELVVADTMPFELRLDREYEQLPAAAVVYNEAGEPLLWRDFDPAGIPVFDFGVEFDLEAVRQLPDYAVRWIPGARPYYTCTTRHLDTEGVPAFSRFTLDYVAEHVTDFVEFEPLTVGVVVKWFGWFLYQLENARL